MFESVSFTGTAKQFVDNGVKINGRFVDLITVANFGKHSVIDVVGFGAKPARGKTPILYRAVTREGFRVDAASFPSNEPELKVNPVVNSMVTTLMNQNQGSLVLNEDQASDISDSTDVATVQQSDTENNPSVD
jgi:hypothetical protein